MSLPWQGAVFALERKGNTPACEGEVARVGLFDKNIHKMSKNMFYKSRDPSQEVMWEAPGLREGAPPGSREAQVGGDRRRSGQSRGAGAGHHSST